MSHFTVAVITDGFPTEIKIEEALAPYQENNCGTCLQKYLKFFSLSKRYKNEYENGTMKQCKLKDGTLVNPWDERLHEYISKSKYQELSSLGKECYHNSVEDKYYVKIEAENVRIPFKEIYPTFEQYLEKYHGAKIDDKTLDYGYWENPNAKWDWYRIGGRWDGLLNIKNKNGDIKPVNYARIKDLVFSEKDRDKAKRFWELVVEELEPITDSDREMIRQNFLNAQYFIDTYGNKEEYADCESKFYTYAIIDKEGRWFSKGNMGFWGMSSDEDDGRAVNYIKQYKSKVFDNAGENDYITIVDCHI